MLTSELFLFTYVLIIGVITGGFLNVCIDRIPKKENIFKLGSQCIECGSNKKWYEMVPLLSYFISKGKCRSCNAKISIQYPLVEIACGIGFVWIFYVNGFNLISILYCLCACALLVLSIIDLRTFEIPFGINVFIFILGIVRVVLDYKNFVYYLIGMVIVSVPLLIIFYATKGRGIGGGDVKLMAAAGLLLGAKEIFLALLLGCVIGSIIHISLMRICKKESVLAFGPYLSIGIFISMLYGPAILEWYLGFYTF